MEWKKFKTGEIIGGKEDTNQLGIKIIEIKYSVKPDAINHHPEFYNQLTVSSAYLPAFLFVVRFVYDWAFIFHTPNPDFKNSLASS